MQTQLLDLVLALAVVWALVLIAVWCAFGVLAWWRRGR